MPPRLSSPAGGCHRPPTAVPDGPINLDRQSPERLQGPTKFDLRIREEHWHHCESVADTKVPVCRVPQSRRKLARGAREPASSIRTWCCPIFSAAIDETFLGRAIELALMAGNVVAARGAAPRGAVDPVVMAVGHARFGDGAVVPRTGSLASGLSGRDESEDADDGGHEDGKERPERRRHDGSLPVPGRLMPPMIAPGA